ncbi:MAG: YciI family protein [Actinomycetaceae bacterium]|nr:YciI family protein [Actinomycetaceae bacterium]
MIAVLYEYDPERRDLQMELRPEHREHLNALHDKGLLVAAGAWGDDGAPGALILINAQSNEAALEILGDDPYLAAGVIQARTARTWTPPIGALN